MEVSMIYVSGILFAMIVMLVIGEKFATEKTERAVEIYKFFLYVLIGIWFGVTSSYIYYNYFTVLEITLIQQPLLPQQSSGRTFI